jgi:large subunit ribosomal protein L4
VASSANAPLNTVKALEQQTVLATIHHFPSLEPLRFEQYPANHLYLPTRRDILHRAVVYEGDMTRLGTASTKTRYEVRGSRRKIRPQKGSGKARLGDKNSPMLRGGGVAFGPKPRDFSTGLQKKVYDLAWRTALSYRYRKGELVIVDNAMEIESPSPKLLKDIFDSHPWGGSSGRSLLVTLEERPLLEQALDAMGRSRQSLTWDEVDVKDLLELSRIVIERDALKNILLSHQEDLTHTALPWYKGMVTSSPPTSLEAVQGWPEFRDLMSVPASDRDEARIEAYESLAAQRWQEAGELPDGHPRKIELTISSLELSAQSKDLLAASPRTFYGHRSHEETKTHHIRILLQTEAIEMRVQALRLRGRNEEADNLLQTASEMREDVDMSGADFYTLEGNKAASQARAAARRGNQNMAAELTTLAEEFFAKADEMKGEVEEELYDGEDSNDLLEQEIDQAELSVKEEQAQAGERLASPEVLAEEKVEEKLEDEKVESKTEEKVESVGEKK